MALMATCLGTVTWDLPYRGLHEAADSTAKDVIP